MSVPTVAAYAQAHATSTDDVIAILTSHDIGGKNLSSKLNEGEIALLDASFSSTGEAPEFHVEDADAAMPADVIGFDDSSDIPDDLEPDSEEPDTAPSEVVGPVHIIGASRGRGAGASRPSAAEIADRDIAYKLRAIQREARPIPGSSWKMTNIDGRQVNLYRPHAELVLYDGKPYYGYPSLLPSDGTMLISANTYEQYLNGTNRRSHMPFVSEAAMSKIYQLIRSYSFYASTCSYPSCTYNRLGKFESGLKRKAELLLRKIFLPPAFPVKAGSNARVMDLKGTCYVHWLLDAMRETILPKWMEVTVLTQDLPDAQRRSARVARFIDVIDQIEDAVKLKAKEGGEREASSAEIEEIFTSFANEMMGVTNV